MKLPTWPIQPDPIGSCFLSNVIISFQFFPYALSKDFSVCHHECGCTRWCKLENVSQNSLENISLRVLAHWPSFINVAPNLSTAIYKSFNHWLNSQGLRSKIHQHVWILLVSVLNTSLWHTTLVCSKYQLTLYIFNGLR